MISIKKEKVLLTPTDIEPSSQKFEVIGIFNPGAIRIANKDIVLYVRVCEKLIKTEDKKNVYSPRMIGKKRFKIKIDRFNKETIKDKSELDFVFKNGTKRLTFISHFRRIVLDKTGFKIREIDKKPSFFGISSDGELGVEDPRITKIENSYIMTYVSLSREGNISTSYAISKDCKNWKRKGIIFGEQDKDVVIFPEKINNKYVAFDRPEGNFYFSPPHIWIAFSKDLEYWGKLKPIRISKKHGWDCGRKGAGPPPIKTKKGWLLIYHAVKEKIKKEDKFLKEIKEIMGIKEVTEIPHYLIGAALFDLKNPMKLIAKSEYPIFSHYKEYEIDPLENKRIIFPTGLVIDENKEDLLIFSGGGDKVVTVKKVSLKEILKNMKKI